MHQIVPQQDWAAARIALMEKEKALTRARDELSAAAARLAYTNG